MALPSDSCALAVARAHGGAGLVTEDVHVYTRQRPSPQQLQREGSGECEVWGAEKKHGRTGEGWATVRDGDSVS